MYYTMWISVMWLGKILVCCLLSSKPLSWSACYKWPLILLADNLSYMPACYNPSRHATTRHNPLPCHIEISKSRQGRETTNHQIKLPAAPSSISSNSLSPNCSFMTGAIMGGRELEPLTFYVWSNSAKKTEAACLLYYLSAGTRKMSIQFTNC